MNLVEKLWPSYGPESWGWDGLEIRSLYCTFGSSPKQGACSSSLAVMDRVLVHSALIAINVSALKCETWVVYSILW